MDKILLLRIPTMIPSDTALAIAGNLMLFTGKPRCGCYLVIARTRMTHTETVSTDGVV